MAVDHDANAVQHVKFLGEGGEMIEVTLCGVTRAAINDEALIARAKVMMVQVAAFSEAPGNDGLSNNTEPSTDRRQSEGMPTSHLVGARFRFLYRDGDSSREIPGVDLPNLEAARDDAIRSATELLAEARLRKENPGGWAVRVYDAAGDIVVEVDFADVEELVRQQAEN